MNLSAIGIACKSIDQSLKLYQMLGLDFKKFDEDHFEATSSQGVRIMLDSFELMKKINPNWSEPQNPGITLCFEQANPQQVDDIFKKLTAAGFQSVKPPWDAFWGQRYASVKDPDGNQVDIFAELKQG
jgi:uncharacterized glyoxalase superfamily protein PhnB